LKANSDYKEVLFIFDMEQTMCVLPVRCRGCGVVFDLWHELREQGTIETFREQGEIQKVVNQLFCWHCRERSGELEAWQDGAEPEEHVTTQTEIEFSLAYK